VGYVSGHAPEHSLRYQSRLAFTLTRCAQMGNTVDVSENEYAVSQFEDKLAAVRKMEHILVH
jgi:hypothetical protein